MRKLSAILALAAATAIVAPAAEAQLTERVGGVITGRTTIDPRTGRPIEPRTGGTIDPRTGTVYGDVYGGSRRESRGSSKVPRGHLPPPGLCRVWIDGVPPGQQPAVSSCATAEAERARIGSRARVIYGDQTPHPGKGRYEDRDRDDDDRWYGRGDRDDDDRWYGRGDRDDDERFERDDDDDDRHGKGRKSKSKGGKGKGKGRGK